ncbi:hypothetical protein HBI56_030250 [Parastagonospora nodorum]|nr:hypothetical protein HBI09_104810 [Parastagonospora nodorum]KAH4943256.1 hypothetical protein HBI79_015830 [Parastagonospora nodorum]KAH5010271.1 hypothetical protein HBI77_088280 [Parastagonospora nodorum]KAH5035247.1 hypothetical protein HBI74_061720 [Parastagonospora nodorum]KAH5085406.1 hypothetical protein HBH95_025110 [Parastagonospora nodorum]
MTHETSERVQHNARIKGIQDTKFVSEESLKHIITEKRIKAQLENHRTANYEVRYPPSAIVATHLKIFAILTMLGKHNDIYEFMEEGISDRSLPLRLSDPATGTIVINGESPTCFRHWLSSDTDGFIRLQDQLNPVFLGRSAEPIAHKEIDDRAVLPFISEKRIVEAGCGTVYKVEIHPDCHGFHNVLPSIDTKKCFALKRLLPRRKDDISKRALGFQKELDALQRLDGHHNEHLVTLLATWTIQGSSRDRYCLLFPWAEGDLLSYWRRESHPCNGTRPDLDAIQWAIKQVAGMASALSTIHNPRNDMNLGPKRKYGRHGDIKSENILWYPPSEQNPRGHLVIADLGLTAFNSTRSRSNIPGESIPPSPDYRPPECDLAGGKISRAFDIWTFGCVLLEMVCWTLDGNQGLVDFEAHRTTPGINGVDTPIYFEILRKDVQGSQNPVDCEHAAVVKEGVHEVCDIVPIP